MSDKPDVGLGPRLLAIETAIRALIEQASLTNPTLRDRIRESADAYLATIPPLSEFEHEFIERARACIASIVRPPIPLILTRSCGAFHVFAGGFFHAQDTPTLLAGVPAADC